MTPQQAHKLLKELHELSPPPLFDGKDYFDNEELKQETEQNENRSIHDM